MKNDKPWTYSHSQLSMYRRCQRLYHDSYILGYKAPTTPNMAFGTLVHEAVEHYIYPGYKTFTSEWWDHQWETWWANFLADCGEDESYDDPIFNLKTAKRCLDLYKRNPVPGQVQDIEPTSVYVFPTGHRYSSRPDFVVENVGQLVCANCGIVGVEPDGIETYQCLSCKYRNDYYEFDQVTPRKRATVDLKFQKKQFNHRPLSPFDDQLLGQAIVHGADAFIRYAFVYDPKTARVDGPPLIEEQAVDAVLAEEWKSETLATILEIESWKQCTHATWPKNDNSCHDFGRECHRLRACRNGFTLDKRHLNEV